MVAYSQKPSAEMTDAEIDEAAILCSAANSDPYNYGRLFRGYRDRPNTAVFLARDEATGVLAGVIFLLDLTYSKLLSKSAEMQAYMLQHGIEQGKCAVPTACWTPVAGPEITSELLRLAEEDAKAKGFTHFISFACLKAQAYEETVKRVYAPRWVETGIPEPLRQPPHLQNTANEFVHFIPI